MQDMVKQREESASSVSALLRFVVFDDPNPHTRGNEYEKRYKNLLKAVEKEHSFVVSYHIKRKKERNKEIKDINNC